jgi:hypothetical protein
MRFFSLRAMTMLFGVRSMNEIIPLDHAEMAYELTMSSKVRFRSVLKTVINLIKVILFSFFKEYVSLI